MDHHDARSVAADIRIWADQFKKDFREGRRTQAYECLREISRIANRVSRHVSQVKDMERRASLYAFLKSDEVAAVLARDA